MPLLDGQVAHHDGGQSDVQLGPLFAADLGEVEAELGAGEQQLGIDVILGERVDAAALGQVAADADPGLAAVGALDDVGLEVAILVVFVGHIDRAGVMLRGQDALHVGILGNAGGLIDLAPVLAAVLGDLHQAVVGADVNQAFHFGRFGDGADVVVERGGDVLLNGVDGPDLAHQRQLVAVELRG